MRRERRRKLTPRELAAITTPGLVTRRIPPPVNIHAPKKEGAKSPSPVPSGKGAPPDTGSGRHIIPEGSPAPGMGPGPTGTGGRGELPSGEPEVASPVEQ